MKGFLILLLFVLNNFAYLFAQEGEDILFQTSTIGALMEGVYDGNVSFYELKKHGDFGLGTFNNLDGEMVALDGKIYQVKSDGKIFPADDTSKTPFATITFFNYDLSSPVTNINLKELEEIIEKTIPSQNLFYAVKISGSFSYVKTRSVPKQNKPYRKLVEIRNNQTEFEFTNVKGTLIGFRTPAYAKGINVAGYHFHFLSNDKLKGGHLLDCVLTEGTLYVDTKQDILINLPSSHEFQKADLNSDKQQDIKKTEK